MKNILPKILNRLKPASLFHLHIMLIIILSGCENKTVSYNTFTQDEKTAFVTAAKEGNLEKIKLFLLQGMNINTQKADGDIALIYAAFYGKMDIVVFLINNGAEIDFRGKDNDTALMWAAWEGHKDIVKYLIEKGAKINLKGDSGFDSIMMAEEGIRMKMSELRPTDVKTKEIIEKEKVYKEILDFLRIQLKKSNGGPKE